MSKAYSPVDVLLGEAVSGSPKQRYRDMLSIASAMANRSALLGVSLDDVVANQREFNAYGKALPPGAAKYRNLAEQALQQVKEQGPVHAGTFYATPKATKNLPKGLAPVDQTKGHQFFTDPYNRAIGTAVGYKKPSMEAAQQLAGLAGKAIPTPADKPSMAAQAAPVGQVTRGLLGDAAASVPSGGLLSADRAPSAPPSFDTGRFAGPVGPSVANFDVGRFAGPSVANFDTGRFASPTAMADAGTIGTSGRVAAPAAPAVPPSTDGLLAAMKDEVQQRSIRGFMPSIDAQNVGKTAPMRSQVAYNDPYVTTQETPTAMAAAPAPMAAYAPQPVAPPAAQAIDAIAPQQQKPAFSPNIQGLLGTLGPAAIGGILAGPIGAIAGGLLGNQLFDPRNRYPSKPTKNSGPEAPKMSKGEIDAMHDRASRSPQARDAWSNGSSGLF